MTVLDTALDPRTPRYLERRSATLERLSRLETALDAARAGGGEKAVTRHHARGKLLPRERVEMLLDQDSPFLELSPEAAWGTEFPVGAGVVTGVGVVEGVECVIIATDPTVARNAVDPYPLEKIRRAARIASANRLPLVDLVESAGEATVLLDRASAAVPKGSLESPLRCRVLIAQGEARLRSGDATGRELCAQAVFLTRKAEVKRETEAIAAARATAAPLRAFG